VIGDFAGSADTADTAWTGPIQTSIIYASGSLINVGDTGYLAGGNNDATIEITGITLGSVNSVTLNQKGQGYFVGDQLRILGGTDCVVTVDTTDGIPRSIDTHQLYNGGLGYTVGDTIYVNDEYIPEFCPIATVF